MFFVRDQKKFEQLKMYTGADPGAPKIGVCRGVPESKKVLLVAWLCLKSARETKET